MIMTFSVAVMTEKEHLRLVSVWAFSSSDCFEAGTNKEFLTSIHSNSPTFHPHSRQNLREAKQKQKKKLETFNKTCPRSVWTDSAKARQMATNRTIPRQDKSFTFLKAISGLDDPSTLDYLPTCSQSLSYIWQVLHELVLQKGIHFKWLKSLRPSLVLRLSTAFLD